MIEHLLPDHVFTEESFDDPPGTPLFAAEEALLTDAVDKRRREFTTVRRCARRALGRMGVAPVPLLPGARGAPGWPAGVVGSMTHCAGYRGAAVARAEDVLTIGIDAEPALPLPEGVLAAVSSEAERAGLLDLAVRRPEIPWDRLLFGAKECVYKAWYPVTSRWLDFEDAEIDFDAVEGTFTARLLIRDRPMDTFAGRWRVDGGIALTAITVAAR